MASELYKPITVSERDLTDYYVKKTIDDNFSNLARHINDLRGWIATDKLADAAVTVAKAAALTIGMRKFRQVNQVIGTGSITKVEFDGSEWDVGSDWDSTNKRFVADVAGYYFFAAEVYYTDTVDEKKYVIYLYKNTTADIIKIGHGYTGTTSPLSVGMSGIVNLAIDDYLEVHTQQISGGDAVIGSGEEYTYFCVAFLGK